MAYITYIIITIFICFATLEHGSAQTLDVYLPDTHTTFELGVINMTCEVLNNVNNDSLTYSWTWAGDPDFAVETQSLVLSLVTTDQAGMYTCVVVVSGNPSVGGSASTELIVEYSPRIPPHVITKFAGRVGENGRLDCKIHSNPGSEFFWSFRQANLTNGGRYSISSGPDVSSLTISSLADNDFGPYSCNAYNTIGKKEFVLPLNKPGKPDVSFYCTEVNTMARGAIFECLPGYQGGEELGFKAFKFAPGVERTEIATNHSMGADLLHAMVQVGDLAPNFNYTILIHQSNTHGHSTESVGVDVWTKDGPPLNDNDPNMMWIFIGAACGGIVLVAVIITIIACCVCRRKKHKPARRFDDMGQTQEVYQGERPQKDTQSYVTEERDAQEHNNLQRRPSWGSFKRPKAVKHQGQSAALSTPLNRPVTGESNIGYIGTGSVSSLDVELQQNLQNVNHTQSTFQNPRRKSKETAPEPPPLRPFMLNLQNTTEESSTDGPAHVKSKNTNKKNRNSNLYDNRGFSRDNSSETCFSNDPANMSGSSLGGAPSRVQYNNTPSRAPYNNAPPGAPYGNVDRMRTNANPYAKAQRMSSGQPSLAGLGALNYLPDKRIQEPFKPISPSVTPTQTPTTNKTFSDEIRRIMRAPSFQPDVPWEFPRNKLYIRQRLGEGSFGEVWKARAEGILGRPGQQTVAVKMLKEHSSSHEIRALTKELEVMKMLQPHPNVILLLGCITKSEPVSIILEYASNGSLQDLLRKHRTAFQLNNLSSSPNASRERNVNLTVRDLIIFASHISSGMQYISSKGLLHRDLASRNVLVDEAMICKICDFGSARDIAEMRQYESQTQRRLPIRWMSPECLFQCEYSVASDVWAYGVVLWEIITLGSSPFPGMSGPDVMKFVQKGCRMSKPKYCSDALYAIMKDCWHQFAVKRPTFSILHERILGILDEPERTVYVDQMAENIYDIIEKQPGEKC